MGKSVLDKQLQIYAEYQSVLRKMTKDEHIRHASYGPEYEKRQQEIIELENRRKDYEREIKEFEKTKPQTGRMGNLTDEQVAALTNQSVKWAEKRRAFDAELKKKYKL